MTKKMTQGMRAETRRTRRPWTRGWTAALCLSALPLFSLAGPAAQAGEKEDMCGYYGNVGAAAIDFLLPLTFQQVVDMVSGKDADLLAQMSRAVEGKGSKTARAAIEKMGDDALELMGEAAGFHGFQLALTGQATNGQEVFERLSTQCEQVGPDQIIDIQRRARAVRD
jgi:hypothetical protein